MMQNGREERKGQSSRNIVAGSACCARATREQSRNGDRPRSASKLGITVTDLAAATGVSVGMLSKIENGNISPSLTTLSYPLAAGR
jgi:ribosome-binding protein aMBF1 (putative translation factor)